MTRTSKRRSVADAQNEATNRLNVKIPSSAYDRLVVHALMSRRSPGEVVAELIESHLRAWRVQANPVKSNDRAEAAIEDKESEAIAA